MEQCQQSIWQYEVEVKECEKEKEVMYGSASTLDDYDEWWLTDGSQDEKEYENDQDFNIERYYSSY